MDKSVAQIWRDTFANWPKQFRRKGVLVPKFGEPIAFCDFVMTDEVVVIERPTPDNVGARRVLIPFALVEAVKYVEPLKTEQFLAAGFVQGDPPKETRQKRPPAQQAGKRPPAPRQQNRPTTPQQQAAAKQQAAARQQAAQPNQPQARPAAPAAPPVSTPAPQQPPQPAGG